MSKLLRELSKPDSEYLRSEALEQLKVTSGKIVACDPLIFNKITSNKQFSQVHIQLLFGGIRKMESLLVLN